MANKSVIQKMYTLESDVTPFFLPTRPRPHTQRPPSGHESHLDSLLEGRLTRVETTSQKYTFIQLNCDANPAFVKSTDVANKHPVICEQIHMHISEPQPAPNPSDKSIYLTSWGHTQTSHTLLCSVPGASSTPIKNGFGLVLQRSVCPQKSGGREGEQLPEGKILSELFSPSSFQRLGLMNPTSHAQIPT